MKRLFRSKKGVSVVIATIILVAIAIVMSIAVAYWVLGLGASFTKYEKVAFISAYANTDSSVILNLKNSGTATATIDNTTIFINGQPGATITYNGGTGDHVTGTMTPGQTLNGFVNFTALPSGTSVEVMLQTTSGGQYPKVVNLP